MTHFIKLMPPGQHHRLGFVTFPGPITYGRADFGGIRQAPTGELDPLPLTSCYDWVGSISCCPSAPRTLPLRLPGIRSGWGAYLKPSLRRVLEKATASKREAYQH